MRPPSFTTTMLVTPWDLALGDVVSLRGRWQRVVAVEGMGVAFRPLGASARETWREDDRNLPDMIVRMGRLISVEILVLRDGPRAAAMGETVERFIVMPRSPDSIGAAVRVERWWTRDHAVSSDHEHRRALDRRDHTRPPRERDR